MKLFLVAVLSGFSTLAWAQSSSSPSAPADGTSAVKVVFVGGFDTEGEDRGRPVVLIASALNVAPQIFRDVFKGVHPGGPGSGGPINAEAQKNKQVLLDGLSKYGVTDDRLNEVSNYYRYRRDSGEVWRHVDAEAVATVKDGVVIAVTVTNPGSGYSSPPTVTVPGAKVNATVILSFGTDLDKNGSIQDITVNTPR
jgi:hypothetical protein